MPPFEGYIQKEKRHLMSFVTPAMGIDEIDWCRNFGIGWIIYFKDKRQPRHHFRDVQAIEAYIKGSQS